MSKIPSVSERYSGKIGEAVLGRGDHIAGGADGMPFLSFENTSKRRVMIAGEVFDDLTDYPELAASMFDGRQKDPTEWALMWRSLGADMICVRLKGTDPDKGKRTPDDAGRLIKKIADATQLPVIVYGCGTPDVDNETMKAVSDSVRGTKLIFGKADEDDYKTISSAAMAGKHGLIAFSNLDVNLAKQMNIILTDFGVDRSDILMDPLMAPLGMGLDYSYSVNERIRLAALSNDKMLQIPMICDATGAWDVGDAVNDEDECLGDVRSRVTWWETMTAMAAMVSGADIVIMRNPNAADMIMGYADELRGD
ncbi:MAG: acetyl-CoA decarbonylase/synthase complex subunit delta [Methanomassiliicoccaceae archaeon]|jgi:acetyl-CoA decarbonylase/synthase complex subunit delta|nr:acetyl-CoA decarbonylase/synthase complex subunit delta [Methanomassiliicoccaceae archaeon]